MSIIENSFLRKSQDLSDKLFLIKFSVVLEIFNMMDLFNFKCWGSDHF